MNTPASIIPAILAARSNEADALKRRRGGFAKRFAQIEMCEKVCPARREAPDDNIQAGPGYQGVFRRSLRCDRPAPRPGLRQRLKRPQNRSERS